MDNRAQTSVEYLLLIASSIVFVVITVAIVRLFVYTPGLADVNKTTYDIKNLTNATLT